MSIAQKATLVAGFSLACCLLSGPVLAQPASPPEPPAASAATDTPAEEAPSTEPAEVKVEITLSEQGVTLIAREADAHEVFYRLGAATGTWIIVNQSVNQKLTLVLRNRTLEEMLETIATGYGLSWSNISGYYMISKGIPDDPASYLLSDIATIPLNYVQASAAKSLLPVFLQDHVHINEQQNAVVLSGPREVLAKFEQDIKQFDIPAEQILIDVLMVELTRDGSERLSSAIQWVNNRDRYSTDSDDGSVEWESNAYDWSTYAYLDDQFWVALRGLETSGDASVRAQPSIATVSGQAAEVFIGVEKYLKTNVQMVGQSSGGTRTSIQAGIRLRVTPWTGGAGAILARIEPEISTLSADDPITGLPEMSSRNASTWVRLKDSQTIVIGGLTQREKRATIGGIPILKDLPLIGKLFQRRSSEEIDTELVIFVTPRRLSAEGKLSPEEEARLKEKFGLEELNGAL